jgi:hypothetical protein
MNNIFKKTIVFVITAIVCLLPLSNHYPMVSGKTDILTKPSEVSTSTYQPMIIYMDGKEVDVRKYATDNLFGFDCDFGTVHEGKDVSKLLTIYNPNPETYSVSIENDSDCIQFTPIDSLDIPPQRSINIMFTLSMKASKTSMQRSSFTLILPNHEIQCGYEFWFLSKQRKIEIIHKNRYFIVDGEKERDGSDIPPFILHDRLQADLRSFAKHLGFIVSTTNDFSSVTMFYDDNTFYFQDGNDRIIVNGEVVFCDPIQLVHHGRMCLPVRFLAEYAGYEVMWDPDEEKATLLWDKD